jgi:hemerythrin-like domain-containing protein
MEKRQPLKRDPALVPLSREHHKGLILAQLLKADVPDYKGLPSDVPGKVAYAKTEYEQRLKAHFEREESWLLPISEQAGGKLADMARRVSKEHQEIRLAIAELHAASSEEALDALGRKLERHIRFEEREWFRALQENNVL